MHSLALNRRDRTWLTALGLLAACPWTEDAGTAGATNTTTGSTDTTGPGTECEDDSDCSGLYVYCEDGNCHAYPHTQCSYYGNCCDDDDCYHYAGGVCNNSNCEYPPQPPAPIVLPPCPPGAPDLSQWDLTQTPSSLGLGDLDGDGDLDLYAALPAAAAIELAFNDGLGGFTPGDLVELGPPQTDLRVAAADLDGDLDLDLAVARPDSSDLLILFGQDGIYTPGPLLPASAPTHTLLAVDLNSDGDIDLVTFGAAASVVSVWNSEGDSFAPEQVRLDLPDSFATSLHALGADGYLDLLALPNPGSGGTLTIYRGTSGLAWLFDQELELDASKWTQALAGDLGTDESLDLIALSDRGNGGSVSVWSETEPLVWSSLPQPYFTASPLRGGVLVDADGDGVLDLVSATGLPRITFLAGDPAGAFACERAHAVPAATAPEVLAAGELDGDSDSELVVGSRDSPTVTVLRSL